MRSTTAMGYYVAAAMLSFLAGMEWLGFLTHTQRHPWLYSAAALIAIAVFALRFFQIRRHVRQLKLGRDGERCVGQFLERLRQLDAQIFHDIPAQGFNLDHVVIAPQGLYVIETKTHSKPNPTAKVVVDGDHVRVGGWIPDRNPITQVTAAARWLENLLRQSTGKSFKVRGVVVFPGWFVEQRAVNGEVWVLEPKMLPARIEREPEQVALSDVKLAAFHLSRYIRTEVERAD